MMSVIKLVDAVLRLFNKTITLLRMRSIVVFLIRALTRVILTAFHILYNRITVHGHHHIPKRGGAVIAANHQSYSDPTLVALSVWRKVIFISKKENHEIPILGPLIELGDSHPINRSGDNDALDFFSDLLKQGHLVIIFPEGTIPAEEDKLRSHVEPKTGLLQGRTGAVRLALKAGVPIIPLGISGSGRSLCPEAIPRLERAPLPKPSKITMRFGPPMDLSQYFSHPVDRPFLRKLTDELMLKISHLVDHQMNFIPHSVPLTEATYQLLREYEAQTRPHPPART